MKIGRSKFTIGALIGFLVGIFLARYLPLDLWWAGGIIAVLILVLIFFWCQIFYRWVIFCVLGLFLGLGYYYIYDYVQNSHQLVYNQKIDISGVIVSPPQIKPTKIQAIVKYQNTKILVEMSRYPEYKYGDILRFEGIIQDPKTIKIMDNFDYGQYLLDKNIRGTVKYPEAVSLTKNSLLPKWSYLQVGFLKIIYSISQKFQDSLSKILPEPYASFQSGLILGNRTTQIPDSLTSAFNRTGTTHIVAVSGYNVTIIISVLAICFALVSRRFSFWATLGLILAFVVMTGGSASVVRAGLLGGLVAWGHLEGRRVNHLILLLVVAFVMVLFNPFQLRGDVGFQLSFLAFAGLIYISPLLSNLKLMSWLPNIVKTVLSETLGAQIVVLPILIYNFGIVSLVAPIVNILVLPFVPTSMLLGFVAGFGGMIWLEIGKILGYIAWILLKYIIVVVESFSRLPWAAITMKTAEWWWIAPYYTILMIWRMQNSNLKNQNKQNE